MAQSKEAGRIVNQSQVESPMQRLNAIGEVLREKRRGMLFSQTNVALARERVKAGEATEGQQLTLELFSQLPKHYQNAVEAGIQDVLYDMSGNRQIVDRQAQN